jgi:hypothetical protein
VPEDTWVVLRNASTSAGDVRMSCPHGWVLLFSVLHGPFCCLTTTGLSRIELYTLSFVSGLILAIHLWFHLMHY